MKFLLFIALVFSSSLMATTLDELIQTALSNNPTLESINHRIDAVSKESEVSDSFSNPTLTYTQNTIDTNQAMSQKTVTFMQKLPYFGKRDSIKKVPSKKVWVNHFKL